VDRGPLDVVSPVRAGVHARTGPASGREGSLGGRAAEPHQGLLALFTGIALNYTTGPGTLEGFGPFRQGRQSQLFSDIN